jgi:hypothetical protein
MGEKLVEGWEKSCTKEWKEGKRGQRVASTNEQPEPGPTKWLAAARHRESGSHVKYKKSDQFAGVAD